MRHRSAPPGPGARLPHVSAITGGLRMQQWLWRFLDGLGRMPPGALVALGVATILLLGVIDNLTGPLLSLSIFYLVPVALIAWVVGRSAGYFLALVAATTWALADRLGPVAAPYTPVSYWNDAVLVGLFLVVVALVARLRATWEWEEALLFDVQRRLLPPDFPPVAGFEIAYRWRPAGAVGGDYYDAVLRPDGRLALCIADVSGKGVPAALVMSNVQATVRALTDECVPVERLAARLNRSLAASLRRGSFVSFFYAVVEPTTGLLEWANAGHPLPLLVRADGTVEQLETSGPVLAVLPTAEYRPRRAELRSGDRLVLFTDGLVERATRNGDEFGVDRLVALAAAHRCESADSLCDLLMATSNAFGDGPFEDDVTLLVAAAVPTPPADPA